MPKINLVPLCIIVTADATPKGKIMKYPNFNKIDPAIRKNMDWAVYIDTFGCGMHYDKVENMGDGADCDCCCTLVPKDFADAAVAMFPTLVKIMVQSEWEDFYNNRAHAHEPDCHCDTDVLQGLAAKKALGILLTQDDQDALNPDNPKAGLRKNENKTWALHNVKRKMTIHPSCIGAPGKKFVRPTT